MGGGTGRTGTRLIERLLNDPTMDVVTLARDPDKVRAVFGANHRLKVVYGDLTCLDSWAGILDEVDMIVTAVSCGVHTDPLASLGIRPLPANAPYFVDYQGIAELAGAAKLHGVQRFVCVTSASTGTPWSAPGIFLNTIRCMSIKWKFEGEQAIRRSGLDYVIIRPYGLYDTPKDEETGHGIEYSQGQTRLCEHR